MKNHGPNSENISQAVLRLGTKQWRVLDAASEGTISKTVGSDADSTAFAIDCSYHIRKIESVLTLLKPW